MVETRAKSKKAFSIIAVAEGAMDKKEAKMKKKEREAYRQETGFDGVANRLARELSELVGVEARAVVPGHIQRGGSPSAYDRVLATQFGVHAAQLIQRGEYGVSVALAGNTVTHNLLSEIAGVPKLVPPEHQLVQVARDMGISLGD